MSKKVENSKTGTTLTIEPQSESDLLSKIINEGRLAYDEFQVESAKDMIGELVKQVMQGQMVISKDTEAMINTRIAQIDKLISAQLNEIMHAEEFQKLEGGLEKKLRRIATG